MIKGIGIDIIEIDRIESTIKNLGEKFLGRVYTKDEIKYCTYKNNLKVKELAVRFAAKEAYAKALGTGMIGIKWKQIEVTNNKAGKPFLKINGKESPNVHVTLSHSQRYAVASVIIQ